MVMISIAVDANVANYGDGEEGVDEEEDACRVAHGSLKKIASLRVFGSGLSLVPQSFEALRLELRPFLAFFPHTQISEP